MVLWELANVIARSLSTIFKSLWHLEEVSDAWNTAAATCVFHKGKKEDLNNNRAVILTSKHTEDQKGGGNSQHGFTKGSSFLTNPKRTKCPVRSIVQMYSCCFIPRVGAVETISGRWAELQCTVSIKQQVL